MARFSKADWRPIRVNFTNGGITPRLVVVHIMQGTLAGSDNWFRNPAAQASAHFGTGKGGALYQWVDTADMAWHCANGNSVAIGIENEGNSGDSLTDAQLLRNAQVLAWTHKVHGIPLRRAHSTGDSGLAWHGMGGAAWGGHSQCPGAPIVAQLDEIVRRAGNIAVPGQPVPAGPVSALSTTEEEEHMMLVTGTSADTIEVFHTQTYTNVMFACDNTRTSSPRPKLRVAMHSNDGTWQVENVQLPNSDKMYVNFDKNDVNFIVITRANSGPGDDVPVAYHLY